MTKGRNTAFSVAVLTILAAVCSPIRYSEYTGKKTIWPTSSGTMSETSYRIPVYRGWPERPYKVLGIRREDSPQLPVAAQAAGRDAFVLFLRAGSLPHCTDWTTAMTQIANRGRQLM